MHGDLRKDESGFTLLEAVVALGIIAMVVTSYLGLRTSAIADGIEARNWRLAREIAEERMSELLAGANELPPESGMPVSLDEKYPGFRYMTVIGQTAIADMEGNLADLAAQAGGAGSESSQRTQWQRNRDTFRKASARGMNQMQYQDQVREDDYQRQLEDRAPSEDEFEEVAVVVYFPKVNGDYPGHEESFIIKAKASTLALSGMTNEQAKMIAESKGEGAGSGSSPLPEGDR